MVLTELRISGVKLRRAMNGYEHLTGGVHHVHTAGVLGTSFNLMNNIIGAGFLSLTYCLQEALKFSGCPGQLIHQLALMFEGDASFTPIMKEQWGHA